MATIFRSNSGVSISRSLLTILTGGIFLFVPGLTMTTVMIVIGTMLVLRGVITFLLSNLKRSGPFSRIWALGGITNMLLGIVFISAPYAMIKIFVLIVGFILLIMGLLQLAGSIRSLTRSVWAWIFLIIGTLTSIGGIYLLANPYKSAEAILPFLGALLILNGVSELFKSKPKGGQSQKYNETVVEDIPYEEV